eukprot:m.54570 g.54570  ORF g.54570 m.54570 type:complete len:610 (-) comp13633_c0_seq1:137-1966(-)
MASSNDEAAAALPDMSDAKPVTTAIVDCPISHVTVFNDRAEVTREFEKRFDEAGLVELTLTGLTSNVLNEDALQVQGTGSIMLLDVGINTVAPKQDAIDAAMKALEDEGKQLEMDAEINQANMTVLHSQLSLLEAYSNYALVPKSNDNCLAPPSVEQAMAVLDAQTTRGLEAKCKLLQLTKESLSIADAKKAWAKRRQEARDKLKPRKDIVLTVQVFQATQVKLAISYQVKKASWTPSYDVRLSSDADNMKLHYYGQIKQNTGEDWNDVALTLSTAQPSVGGRPPTMPSRIVHFPVHTYHGAPMKKRKGGKGFRRRTNAPAARAMASLAPASDSFGGGLMLDDDEGGEDEDDGDLDQLQVASAQTSNTALSTTFELQQRANIASDDNSHKVTLLQLELAVKQRHYCVPSKATDVYLQAQVINTSDVTLLPSMQALVYLDGSIITTTSLDLIAPGERFTVFLGVDASIKLTYRPPNGIRSSQYGLFSGKSHALAYEHRALVKNTKSKAVVVVMVESLPKSNDSTIKVRLLQPASDSINESKGGAAASNKAKDEEYGGGFEPKPVDKVELNPFTNNLIFTRVVGPKDEREMVTEYAIDYPDSKRIVIDSSA